MCLKDGIIMDSLLESKTEDDWEQHKLLNKYCAGVIIRFLINHLQKVRTVNSKEVAKIIKQIKEPFVPSEKQATLIELLNDNLFKAASEGSVKEVKILLSQGANPDFQAGEGFTPLIMAILKKHTNVVKELLENGANPNLDMILGKLPLMFVVQQGSPDILELMLKHGANPNCYGKNPINTPLNAAISKQCQKSVKLLLKYGASKKHLGRVDDPESEKIPPIIYAILYGGHKIVKLLLPDVENINYRWGLYKATPLIIALNKRDFKTAKLLLDHGADCNIQNKFGDTPLIRVILLNTPKAVRMLLNMGADVNLVNEADISPLIIASNKGYSKIVKLLLKHGAKVSFESKYYRSVLIQAILTACNLNVIKLLIEAGANLNASFIDGYTALKAAIEKRNIRVVKMLLKYGADANLRNKFGETALIRAVQLKPYQKNIVRELLKHGAKLELGNDLGTPLMHAAYCGNKDAIEDLLRLGVNINTQHLGITPLIKSIWANRRDTVELLLKFGSNPNARTKTNLGKDIIPLAEAVECRSVEIIQTLLDYGADPDIISKSDLAELKANLVKYFRTSEVIKIIEEWENERRESEYGKSINYEELDHPKDKLDQNKISEFDRVLRAIKEDNIEVIKEMLESGVDPNLVYEGGLSILALATIYDRFKIIELLLKHKADPNKYIDAFSAPIYIASLGKKIEILKILLKHGADPNVESGGYGYTPLLNIIFDGDVKIVRLLLMYGANPNVISNQYATPLSNAIAFYSMKTDVIKVLLEYGADPNIGNVDGEPLLMAAAKRKDEEAVKLLLKHGALFSISRSNEVLDLVLEKGYVEATQMLIEQGARPTFTADKINGIFERAIEKEENDFIRLILKYSEILQLSVYVKELGLIWGAKNGEVKIIEFLLNKGVNINTKDKHGSMMCQQICGQIAKQIFVLFQTLPVINNHWQNVF